MQPTDALAVPLTEAQRTILKQELVQAKAARQPHERWWEANLRAYAPLVTGDPESYASAINTNRDFVSCERKKSDLFNQRPDVSLQPSPLMEGPLLDPQTQQPVMGPPNAQGQAQPVAQSVCLTAHQAIMNEKLGPEGVDALAMVHQCLFDIQVTSGTGWTKMGYEQFGTAQQVMDPTTGEPRTVTIPVKDGCFWHYLPPKQALIPATFRSTEWDRAPWLAHAFELPLTAANRAKFHLPDDFEGGQPDATQHFDHGHGTGQDGARMFTGIEMEYRSVLYRDDIVHPDHLTLVIFVDGLDAPVIHQDSPHQTIDANGRLTADSLIGFSMHGFTVRAMTDTAYPPSDSTMIRPLVNELNVYRTQQVQFRDAALTKFMANGDVLPREALEKIIRSPIGGIVVVPGEAYHGEGAIKELPQGNIPRENFTGMQAIDDDIARTVGVDGSGAGVQTGDSQTATEANIQQGNANARLGFERGLVLQAYVRGVTKFSTLQQRYLSVEGAGAIVGPALAASWDIWRRSVSSALAFTALPDAALRSDLAANLKRDTEFYSFIANDPYCQGARIKVLEKLFRGHHIDPGALGTRDPRLP